MGTLQQGLSGGVSGCCLDLIRWSFKGNDMNAVQCELHGCSSWAFLRERDGIVRDGIVKRSLELAWVGCQGTFEVTDRFIATRNNTPITSRFGFRQSNL